VIAFLGLSPRCGGLNSQNWEFWSVSPPKPRHASHENGFDICSGRVASAWLQVSALEHSRMVSDRIHIYAHLTGEVARIDWLPVKAVKLSKERRIIHHVVYIAPMDTWPLGCCPHTHTATQSSTLHGLHCGSIVVAGRQCESSSVI